MALFSQLLLKDGCILDHLAAIDASTLELGKFDSKSLVTAIKGIKSGELALKELKQMDVFLEILSNAILSNPVPDVQVMSTLPLFLSSLASTLNRHREMHPKIVEESASKMWGFVRDLFDEGSSMGKHFSVHIVSILVEMLPHVFDIFDWAREKIHLLRDVCTLFVIATQCDPKEVTSVIDKGFRPKLGKIGSCVEVPDFQVQSLAIEILIRMKKYIPEELLKKTLPSQLRQHWPRLLKPNTFCEEVRSVLNDYNSNKALHHPKTAVFSLKASNSVTTFEGSDAKFDLNLEWFDVGSSSITCDADLKDGQGAEPLEFFFRNVRDAKFSSESSVLSLELQFVCKELSRFLQEGCNGEIDERTIHFLTVKLRIDNEKVATTFKTEFHDRCRLSPSFATPKDNSFKKPAIVQAKMSTKKDVARTVKNPHATKYNALDLSPTLPIRKTTSKENTKSSLSLSESTTKKKSPITGNKHVSPPSTNQGKIPIEKPSNSQPRAEPPNVLPLSRSEPTTKNKSSHSGNKPLSPPVVNQRTIQIGKPTPQPRPEPSKVIWY
jgi:hypothetical protein